MSIGYGAVERFGPEDGDLWTSYLAFSGIGHLKEVVTLDNSLCPSLVNELTEQDWQHNGEELIFFFRDLDYLLARYPVSPCYQVLAVVKNPTGSETLPDPGLSDPRFSFLGYDLIEAGIQGGTSAVTNCGGWDNAAVTPEDVTEVGLLASLEKARHLQQFLPQQYPDDPHALCDLYAVWRMNN